MKILHLDSGRDWRGGQQQLLYLVEGLKIHLLEQKIAVRAGGRLANRLEALHIPFSNLPFRSEWGPASLLGLSIILRRFRPEIVHAHDSRTFGLAAILRAVSREFQLVASRRVAFPIRGNPLSMMKYQRAPSMIIAVSRFIRDSLIEQGIDPSKIKVIPDGIVLPPPANQEVRYSTRRRFGIAEDEFLIGSVGQLTREKGHEILIRGFKQVQVRQPRARLLIAGDGPLLSLYHRLVEELGLHGTVMLPGSVADLGSVLPALDLFVYPSLQEGLGSVLLLVMAYRIPICASRTGGIPELVLDRSTGRLFSPGDPAELAEVIAWAMLSPNQMSEYARNAYVLVTQQFLVERMVSATFDLYTSLLNR